MNLKYVALDVQIRVKLLKRIIKYVSVTTLPNWDNLERSKELSKS